MEEFKEALKKAGKVIWKSLKTILFPFAIIFCIVLILFSSFVYFITIDDGTYKEDDWSSTPYAASEFVNNTTINEDGTINNSISAEDLWNKMLENDSRVDEYLDSSEELARLMKAEMVTQYPDTRPNPDEPIDWDSVIKGDTTQGIIKFKRADTDGNKSTMTYVDPSTFQGYIDEYNSTGSESAKQAALSHFTLKRSSGTTGSSGGVNYNGPDLCWPTTSTNITSNFGPRGAPTAGASTNHQGIDIAVPSNSEVYACEDGVVKTAAFDDSAGNYVEVDHGNGYQTVYAKNLGSAAAPTAGLHFTTELLEKIKAKGVEIIYVTLNVGLGTFRPVNVEDVSKHKMHSEAYHITSDTAKRLNAAMAAGKRIIAVGTTSCRVLETIADSEANRVNEGEGDTSIFIYPGYKFKMVDCLITNFHLPESSLLMLVSALADKNFIMKAYKEAIKEKYRFFSFGDAMFIK